jgi:hypothetical protein
MSDLRQRAHGDDGRRGIWFHRYELMRVDESHESARELLLNIERPEPCRGPHEAPVLHQGRRRRDGTTLLQRETPGNRGRLPGRAAATGSTPASWHHPRRVRLGIRQGEAVQKYFSALFDPRLAAEHARSKSSSPRPQIRPRAQLFLPELLHPRQAGVGSLLAGRHKSTSLLRDEEEPLAERVTLRSRS